MKWLIIGILLFQPVEKTEGDCKVDKVKKFWRDKYDRPYAVCEVIYEGRAIDVQERRYDIIDTPTQWEEKVKRISKYCIGRKGQSFYVARCAKGKEVLQIVNPDYNIVGVTVEEWAVKNDK